MSPTETAGASVSCTQSSQPTGEDPGFVGSEAYLTGAGGALRNRIQNYNTKLGTGPWRDPRNEGHSIHSLFSHL